MFVWSVRWSVLVGLGLMVGLLAGCNIEVGGTPQTTPSSTPEPTAAEITGGFADASTGKAGAPKTSGAPEKTSAAPSGTSGEAGSLEKTPAPARPVGKTERLSFPSGGTSVEVEGAVVLGTRDSYLLEARVGQRMNVSISSLEGNAVFQIYEPGGSRTLDGAGERDDAMDWSGELPADGDYTVVVGGTRGNATYTLEVTIM